MSVENITFEAGYMIITHSTGAVRRYPISGLLRAADIPSISADQITSGELGAARIPNLNASKINAGAFHVDRIPSINADKVNAGTLGVDRIPGLGAAKITSGSFGTTRIADGAITADKLAAPDLIYIGVYGRTEYGRCVYGTE